MDHPDDRSASYEYDFDDTDAGDLRMSRAKYAKLVDAYRLLRDELQAWNERVRSETGAEAPYLREVEDLDRTISWSEELPRSRQDVAVRGISVGSLRYAKAAMLLYLARQQKDRAAKAEAGWPATALKSLDNDIEQLRSIADSISQEPSGVLRELNPHAYPPATGNEPKPVGWTDSSDNLHLEALSISGFRGIDALTIPKLGRVTLLSGRNGIGKTTVLDAVRAYAARGRPEVLVDLLERHEELARQLDEDGDPVDLPDVAALFHARNPQDGFISVGPNGNKDALRMELSSPKEWPDELGAQFARMGLDPDLQAIKVQFNEGTAYLPWATSSNANARRVRYPYRRIRGRIPPALPSYLDDDLPEEIACNLFGPGPTSNERLAELWDEVTLEPEEELAVEALRLVLGEELERVAVVGPAFPSIGRRFVVRLSGDKRASLASFGDGAVRLFGIALTLVRSRDGFLVIDEAENGIHHSIQQDFWRLVIKAAVEYRVQVLATTHSKDCIDSFGRAAKESDAEGVLLRLERRNGKLRAIQYEEDEIVTAAEQGIETR